MTESTPVTPPKRRCDDPENCEHVNIIYDRLDIGSKRMDMLESAMAINTEATMEARDILVAAKGAFKVLGWLGVIAKWAGGIATACIAIYVAFYVITHGGRLPGGME
ncbi:MAG: hypothetical protein Q8N51_05745 [Gammaproteobacteria bacterium]|nr:hypothetical protein [Gammaproteobacteria bacterium]